MFTNKTENLNLPQWVGTDKANWDVDLNYAFKQISDYVTTLNEKFSSIDYTENDIKNDIQTINNNISSINTVLDSLNEVTTNHSSEISSLKEKVTKLQSDVSSLTTDFSESSANLTQRIQSIEEELPSIQQSITTLTQNYNEINVTVAKLKERTVIFEKNVTYPIDEPSDSFTETFSFAELVNNITLEVDVAPSFLKTIALSSDTNTYKILTVGFSKLQNLKSGDVIFTLCGIPFATYTNGYLKVTVDTVNTSGVTLKFKYSPASYSHNFNDAPAIVIKMKGEKSIN